MQARSRPFNHNGRALEVHAVPVISGNFVTGWRVRVLENGRPITGVVYNVSWDTAIDAALQEPPADLVDELMRNAQAAVERGYDRLY